MRDTPEIACARPWRRARRAARLGRLCTLGAGALALALATSACADDDATTSSAPTESAASPTVAPTSGHGASASSGEPAEIPTVDLVTDVPSSAVSDGAVTRSALVTMVSERLGDHGGRSVQTVVCDGGVSQSKSSPATCTVTLQGESGQSTVESWLVYPTHNADGSRALHMLHGDALSDEFTGLLEEKTSYLVAGEVSATFGAEPVQTQQVRTLAQTMLHTAQAPMTLHSCTGTLDFASFEPVACEGTQGGAKRTVLVLPGEFPAGSPGLLIAVLPAD